MCDPADLAAETAGDAALLTEYEGTEVEVVDRAAEMGLGDIHIQFGQLDSRKSGQRAAPETGILDLGLQRDFVDEMVQGTVILERHREAGDVQVTFSVGQFKLGDLYLAPADLRPSFGVPERITGLFCGPGIVQDAPDLATVDVEVMCFGIRFQIHVRPVDPRFAFRLFLA